MLTDADGRRQMQRFADDRRCLQTLDAKVTGALAGHCVVLRGRCRRRWIRAAGMGGCLAPPQVHDDALGAHRDWPTTSFTGADAPSGATHLDESRRSKLLDWEGTQGVAAPHALGWLSHAKTPTTVQPRANVVASATWLLATILLQLALF